MKSMTIHKIDDHVLEAIASLAEERGQSINAAIKQLLAKSVGLEPGNDEDTPRSGYRRFLNRWSPEEASAFTRAAEDFSVVDESDWSD